MMAAAPADEEAGTLLNAPETENASLRRQLMQFESERARLELDFMNQIVAYQETTDKLTTQLAQVKEENMSLKNQVEESQEELAVSRREVEGLKETKDSEGKEETTFDGNNNPTKAMEADLLFKIIERKDETLKEKDEQIQKLQGQKTVLMEEITSLRLVMGSNNDKLNPAMDGSTPVEGKSPKKTTSPSGSLGTSTVTESDLSSIDSRPKNLCLKTTTSVSDESSLDMSSFSGMENGDLEDQLAAKTQEIQDLQETVNRQLETINELHGEIETLSEAHEQETASLKVELEMMQQNLQMETMQVDKLQAEIKDLAEREKEAKSKEEQSTMGRRTMDKEANRLQVALTNVRMSMDEQEKDYLRHVEALEQELDDWKVEADEELEEKEKEVNELQRSLDVQKGEIARLVHEREQICLSMNEMSSQRKKEIDELQAELMQSTLKNSELERSVEALQTQVGDKDTSIKKIQEIVSLNESLQQHVRQLNIEKRSMQEKLSDSVSENGLPKSINNLMTRNQTLQNEVTKLRKRVKTLQGSINRVERVEI